MNSASTNWLALLLAGPVELVEKTSVKDAFGILAFTFAVALVAYGAGHWEWLRMSEERQRVLWLCTWASLPWSVGILAAKLLWRFDEHGQPMFAYWHWGQVIMATVAVIVLAGVGLIGFLLTLLILSDCPVPDWNIGCRVGLWGYGFLGAAYGAALVLIAPFVLWWDSFRVREQRTNLTSAADITQAFEAGRRAGRDETIRRLKKKARTREQLRRDQLGER